MNFARMESSRTSFAMTRSISTRSAVLLAALLPIAMGACAATPASGKPATNSTATSATTTVTRELLMREGAWALKSVSKGASSTAQALQAPGIGIKLQFVDQLTVLGGCNQLSGDYRVEKGELIVGTLASTKMACADVPRVADQTMFALLAQPLKARMVGKQLELRAASGEVLLFDAIPLTR